MDNLHRPLAPISAAAPTTPAPCRKLRRFILKLSFILPSMVAKYYVTQTGFSAVNQHPPVDVEHGSRDARRCLRKYLLFGLFRPATERFEPLRQVRRYKPHR